MWGDGEQDKDVRKKAKKAIPLEPDFTDSFSILQSKPYSPYLPGSVSYENQPICANYDQDRRMLIQWHRMQVG